MQSNDKTLFSFLSKSKLIVLCALGLAIVLVLLHVLRSRLLILNNFFEWYGGAIAILFTGLGIWLAKKLIDPKVHEVIIEKEVFVPVPNDFIPDEKNLAFINLSKREIDVLELMALGLSNDEIAAKLFVSTNTIKTHSSNIFVKLDVKRRIQAVEKAKQLKIIASAKSY
jgi:DNA-binding CsgD family transcriptional regulator